MSLTSSPKLIKGGLVVLDAASGAIQRTVLLQYYFDARTVHSICTPHEGSRL
jgi:hypothetical protein